VDADVGRSGKRVIEQAQLVHVAANMDVGVDPHDPLRRASGQCQEVELVEDA